MDFETIELKKENRIGIITLNRPKVLNAFNEQLVWDLQEATHNLKEEHFMAAVLSTELGNTDKIYALTEECKKLGISVDTGKGYRALVNISEDGGQEVPHLHFHLFGGEKVGKTVQ